MTRFGRPGFLTYFMLFLLFFGGIYFYFLPIQTQTIYGDDLSAYQVQAHNTSFSGIMAAGKNCFKFRPVSDMVVYLEVHIFRKWLPDYFLFNVGIQALIAVVFTAILNLFLRSVLLSAFIGLLAAFSRFAFYNITQLMCGGPLEGLAMLFFLAALYNMVIYLTYSTGTPRKSQFYYLIWVVIFSNLAMYSHERYLVLFPVIILFTLFHPLQNKLVLKQKVIICLLSATSVFANFALKVYIYHYPFLLGTGTSSLTHDFILKKQLGFLGDGIASILQFNSGPEYLMGIAFPHADTFHQVIIISAIIMLCALVCWYVFSNRQKNNLGFSHSVWLVLFLLVLFFATLLPAVSTLELEQRWLQAPYSLFVLAVVIVFVNIRTNHALIKKCLLILFISAFLVSDYIYMVRMDGHFWMKSSEWVAACFKNEAVDGFMVKELNSIYMLEDKRDQLRESQFTWVLWYGTFFDFYQGKPKTIYYIDSNKFVDDNQLPYMINFDKKTEQIIRFDNGVKIITDDVLRERDKYFKEHGFTAKYN